MSIRSQSTLVDTDAVGVLDDLRAVFATGRTRSLSWRLEQLRGIERLLAERESEIASAIGEDLDRPYVEAFMGDIANSRAEATYARKHLKSWLRSRRVSLPLTQLPGRACVQYDP